MQHCIVIWGKNRTVKIKGRKRDRPEYYLRDESLENLSYHLLECPLLSSNQEKQQSIPYHALYPTPIAEHTQKS